MADNPTLNPARFPKLGAFFLLLVFSVTGAFLIGEVLVRVLLKPDNLTPAQRREQSLQFDVALFAKSVLSRKELTTVPYQWNAQYHINAKGYRGHDFAVPKPGGTIRVMIYGGSSVFDLNAPLNKDWPQRVEDILHQKGYSRVEVINAGVPGHSALDDVGRLLTEGYLFSPDYVVLYTGWNDIRNFHQREPLLRVLKPYEPQKDPRISYLNVFDRFFCEHSKMYLILRDSYFQQQIGLEGKKTESRRVFKKISESAVQQFALNAETFADLAHNIHATPVFVTEARSLTRNMPAHWKKYIGYEYQQLTHDAICDGYDAIDRILKTVAQEKRVPLLDASAEMTGDGAFFQDHVHLNVFGSQYLAELTAQFLAQLIDAAARSSGDPTGNGQKRSPEAR